MIQSHNVLSTPITRPSSSLCMKEITSETRSTIVFSSPKNIGALIETTSDLNSCMIEMLTGSSKLIEIESEAEIS